MLTRRTTAQQAHIKVVPGSPLSLVCEALASPRPSVSWSREGRVITSSPTLSIPSLTERDSGVYVCRASNPLGSTTMEFSVTVSSPRVELPAIVDMANTSARVGERAVLQCSVTSSLPPSVQWLRRVEEGEEGTLRLDSLHLASVARESDTRVVRVAEDTYLDTLVLHAVEEQDQGLYVCFATNTAGGFNYQTVQLTVVQEEVLVDGGEELFLGLVVGLVVVVLLLLTTILTCLVRGRTKLLIPDYEDSQVKYTKIHFYELESL